MPRPLIAAIGCGLLGVAMRVDAAHAGEPLPMPPEVPATRASRDLQRAPDADGDHGEHGDAPPAATAEAPASPDPATSDPATSDPATPVPATRDPATPDPATLATPTSPPISDDPFADGTYGGAPPSAEPARPPAVEGGELSMADDPGDQGVGAAVGLATGGRTTAGGFRVTGQYTYQMSSTDWFDGTASFTFGGGDAACFRDRADMVLCDHGFVDGNSVELAAGVRRYFAPQGQFRPFARLAVGVSLVRFGDDDITGIAVPVHVGGGLRARVNKTVAIVAFGELMFGLARFRDLGTEPQAGFAVTAGAEFRLK